MEFPSGREQKSSGDCARQDIVKSAQQSSQAKTYTDRFAFVWGTRFLAIVESRFPHGQARLVRSHFLRKFALRTSSRGRIVFSNAVVSGTSASPGRRSRLEESCNVRGHGAQTVHDKVTPEAPHDCRSTLIVGRALQPRRPSSRKLQSIAIRRIHAAAAEAGSHADWFVTIVELLFGWRTRPRRPHQRPP